MSHFNVVDILIVIAAIMAARRGARLGFGLLALSLAGFFGGLYLGSILAPHLTNLGSSSLGRSVMALGITLGSAFLGAWLGEIIALRLRHILWRLRLDPVDHLLGAIFEIVAVLLTVWLLSTPLARIGWPQVEQSVIISGLSSNLPSAPNVIARLGSLIEPNGFPHVFLGPEPTPSLGPVPSLAALNSAIGQDKASVVKIEGRGCGGLVVGSGFVARPGLVLTNAHVVAGLAAPQIFDQNGNHPATVVWFDPNLDLAALRTGGLAGRPLALAGHDQPAGTIGAVMGYPGGGDLSVVSARILGETDALGRNIYDSGLSRRRIYELQAEVEPGNSGGPLINADGSVSGIVFAKSQSFNQVGFAITSTEVAPELRQAASSGPVSTGACAAD